MSCIPVLTIRPLTAMPLLEWLCCTRCTSSKGKHKVFPVHTMKPFRVRLPCIDHKKRGHFPLADHKKEDIPAKTEDI